MAIANEALYFTREQWRQLLNGMAQKIKDEIDTVPSEQKELSLSRANVSVDTDKQVITVQPEDSSKPIVIGYNETMIGETSTLTLTYPDGANFKVEVK